MEKPDVKNILISARSIKASTPRSRVTQVVGDLVSCVEHLAQELQYKTDQNSTLGKNQFGKKSEKLNEGGESVSADTASEGGSDELQTEIKNLLAEASRLSAGLRPEKKSPREARVQDVCVDAKIESNDCCSICGSRVVDQGFFRTATEIGVSTCRFIKKTIRVHKGSCSCGATEVKHPGPVRGIPGTNYSPRFIARIICDKFRLSLPLHRQFGVMESEGLGIDRSVLSRLLHRHIDIVNPIIDRIWQINRKQDYVGCDESPIRYVTEDGPKKAFLFCMVTTLAVTYKIASGRSKLVVESILGTDGGDVLQTDGLNIYENDNLKRKHAGCLAHLRRYFFQSLISFPAQSIQILELIAQVYRIENRIKNFSPEEKLKIRQAISRDLMDKIHHVASGFDPPPRSTLGKAVRYLKKHWPKVICFLEDGRVRADNNHVEGAIRLPKLGFKNFLFTRSAKGNAVVSGYYTLIATCLLHGVDPEDYLEDVTYRINTGWPNSRIDELLPWHWEPCNRETMEAERLKKAVKFRSFAA